MAGRALVWPYSVTVMLPPVVLVKSSITWLFVITSPFEVMIIPVPSSSLPPALTSMETTAGITSLTSWGMVTLPLRTAAPGAELLSWMVTLSPPLLLWSTKAVTPEPTSAPMTAAMTATATQRRPFFSLGSVVARGTEGGGGKPEVVGEPRGGVALLVGAAGAMTGNGHPGWDGGGAGGAGVRSSAEAPAVGLPGASIGGAETSWGASAASSGSGADVAPDWST